MENKKKRRGMLAVLLGLVLTVCGGALTLTVGGRLECPRRRRRRRAAS